MKTSEILSELKDLVLSGDLKEPDVNILYSELRPHITALAGRLHVASAHLVYDVEPYTYELHGRHAVFDEKFSDEAAPEEYGIELRKDNLGHISLNCRMLPVAGWEWTEDERHWIAVVSRLVLMEFSRANMIRMRNKVPYTDPATGLANSAGIAHYAKDIEAVHSMKRYTGCYFNIKNFSYISRQYGISFSDTVICSYAHRIYDFLDPETELVSRVAGDNFFALVQNFHIDDFVRFISDMKITEEHKGLPITVNLGAWVGLCPGTKLDRVIDLLDKSSFASDQAKKSRMSIVTFDQDDMDDAMYEKQISEMIPDAIKQKEIIPFYQPKVLLDDGSLYGCEALSRWLHDGLVIPPSDFIPVAENNGLITRLDLHILECVCRDIRGWLDQGLEPVRVSVNYSQKDFYSPTLIKDTLDILHRYELDGKYLEIEITESSFQRKYEALDDFVRAMHENGLKVSLDDFGTGYSSLNMIKRLDLDSVKLDRSFFDGLGSDGKGSVILHSVAAMINGLNTVTVAEGIETDDQLKMVYDIGGRVVQGFYFDRPLVHDQFTERLKSRRYAVKKP